MTRLAQQGAEFKRRVAAVAFGEKEAPMTRAAVTPQVAIDLMYARKVDVLLVARNAYNARYQFEKLVTLLDRDLVRVRYAAGRESFELDNGSRLTLASLGRPEAARGLSLDYVLHDEPLTNAQVAALVPCLMTRADSAMLRLLPGTPVKATA